MKEEFFIQICQLNLNWNIKSFYYVLSLCIVLILMS